MNGMWLTLSLYHWTHRRRKKHRDHFFICTWDKFSKRIKKWFVLIEFYPLQLKHPHNFTCVATSFNHLDVCCVLQYIFSLLILAISSSYHTQFISRYSSLIVRIFSSSRMPKTFLLNYAHEKLNAGVIFNRKALKSRAHIIRLNQNYNHYNVVE